MPAKESAMFDAVAELVTEVKDDAAPWTPARLRGKNLATDVGLDSLEVLKFILLVEERLKIQIPDADIDGKDLLSVDKLVAYLQAQTPTAS